MTSAGDVIDTLLRKSAARADAAEVFFESSESRPVEFENNKLKYITTKAARGVGLRVIKDGRVGFSSSSDFNRLDELVENALESAKFGERALFEFPGRCEVARVETSDRAVGSFGTREMAELGRAAIDRVLSRHPEVQCSAEIFADAGRERIANTSGLDIGHDTTDFSVQLSALSVGDDGFVWAGDGRGSARLFTDLAPITDKVIRDLDLARKVVPISTGSYPAIFTPDAVAVLLISLSQGVNGKLVQKGASPLTARLGETIVDERITVYDDGLIDYAAASAPHDTEGIASRRTVLFEKGVLRNYIFDLQTAALLNAAPTGNGIRGYSSQPDPGHNNTVFLPGDTPFEEMVRRTRCGLLVEGVLGAGMSNTLAGEFSLNLELGFLIENGAIVGRVKNCMIFGNVYDLLKSGIEAIGDKCEMKSSLSLPHILCKEVRLGTQ